MLSLQKKHFNPCLLLGTVGLFIFSHFPYFRKEGRQAVQQDVECSEKDVSAEEEPKKEITDTQRPFWSKSDT